MSINTGMFPDTVITNAGKQMIVESQNGAALKFTRVALGDGILGDNEDELELTTLKNEKLSVNISSYKDLGTGQFTLTFTIDNSQVEKGFWHREIGIMASVDDGPEKLYAYTNAGSAASFLFDKTTPVQARTVKIDFVVGSAKNVEVVVDKSIVYATHNDLSEHDADENAHAALLNKINNSLVEANGYGIVSGCEPSIDGLVVTVADGVIRLANGRRLNFKKQSITLANSETDNPRNDRIYIDENGTLTQEQGTAGFLLSAVAGKATYKLSKNILGGKGWAKFNNDVIKFAEKDINGYVTCGKTVTGYREYTVTTAFVAGDTVAFDGNKLTCGTDFQASTNISTSAFNLCEALRRIEAVRLKYTLYPNGAKIIVEEQYTEQGTGNTPPEMTVTGTGAITNGTATESSQDIATTVTNLINLFNTNSTLSAKYTAEAGSSSDEFVITEKVPGSGNTPRNFKPTTYGQRMPERTSFTRSVQAVINPPPALTKNTVPICVITLNANASTGTLTDDRKFFVKEKGNVANVESYGALGDGITDDSAAIQKAFDSGKDVYFPNGTYRLDTMVTCYKGTAKLIDFERAKIEYTGKDYAFSFGNLRMVKIKASEITALNGGCVQFIGNSTVKYSNYVEFDFMKLYASTDCIKIDAEDWVWMNEFKFKDGVFLSGDNGFHYYHNATNGASGYIFDHVSCEGPEVGFNFEISDKAMAAGIAITDAVFIAPRFAEQAVFIKSSGPVQDFLIERGYSNINETYLEIDSNATDWNFARGAAHNAIVHNGILFDDNMKHVINDADGAVMYDANNLLTEGEYTFSSYNVANRVANVPSNRNLFSIKVKFYVDLTNNVRRDNIFQVLTKYTDTDEVKYKRQRNTSGVWTDWKQMTN